MKKFVLPAVLLLLCVVLLCFLGRRADGGSAAPSEPDVPAVSVDSPDRYPQLIAHAGGAVYGYRLTNSLEALDQAYQNGFRYIELDLELTSDAQIVLIHDWEGSAQRLLGSAGRRTLESFSSAPVMAGLHLLTLDQLLDWLSAHPDCSIITDTKSEDNRSLLEQLMNRAGGQASAFIPQTFSYEEFQQVRSLGFDRVILSLYKMSIDPAALTQFAQDSQPWAVTIPAEAMEQTLLTSLSQSGISVYAHTVDSVDFFDQWSSMGLTGLYTNYFSPARWLY